MPRPDGRTPDQLRLIVVTRDFLLHPEGSVLVEFGATKVICTASVEDKVPPFLKGQGLGWVTAEYAMLPRSTNTRTPRENRGPSGRSQEIQRLVGRALRAVIDRGKMGERTVWVDCDVIQADGGTRTAAITGGFIAVADAIAKIPGLQPSAVIRDCVAAISVGVVQGQAMLDLCYAEDAIAEVDMNVVMTGSGEFVEGQGTAEQVPFGRARLDALLAIAASGLPPLTGLPPRALRRPRARRRGSVRPPPRGAPWCPARGADGALPLRGRPRGRHRPGAHGRGRRRRRDRRRAAWASWLRLRSALLLPAAPSHLR